MKSRQPSIAVTSVCVTVCANDTGRPSGLRITTSCLDSLDPKHTQTPLDTFRSVIHHCITMKTATVRDLRNHFARLSAWVENGESVEITKGGKVFARLVPVAASKSKRLPKVDFTKQLRKTWGNRVISAKEIAEMRAAELEGEEG